MGLSQVIDKSWTSESTSKGYDIDTRERLVRSESCELYHTAKQVWSLEHPARVASSPENNRHDTNTGDLYPFAHYSSNVLFYIVASKSSSDPSGSKG